MLRSTEILASTCHNHSSSCCVRFDNGSNAFWLIDSVDDSWHYLDTVFNYRTSKIYPRKGVFNSL